MKGYFSLYFTIIFKTILTYCLSMSKQSRKLLQYIQKAFAGHALSFFFLNVVLKTISKRIAYIISIGVVCALTTLISLQAFRQNIYIPTILVLVLITQFRIIMKLLSKYFCSPICNEICFQQRINIKLKKGLIPFIFSLTVMSAQAQTHLHETNDSTSNKSAVTLDSVAQKQNLFKKFLNYFNDANKEKEKKKFDFSIIGGPHYSSDTKLGLGLVAVGLYYSNPKDTILPPSKVSLYGDVSTVGFYMLGIRGTNLSQMDRYRLNYNLYFYSFPSSYWGKGYENGANNDNESSYNRFQAQVKVDFMFRLAKNFYIGPMASFDYVYGRNFEKPELWEGMSKRTSNLSTGFSLLYDSRDFLTNAYKGGYLKIDQRFSPSFLGNKYAFSSTELDARYYHTVWKGGVLAGQFHTQLNYGNPPWGLMAFLGSSYSMRGYYEGRYRDKCVMDGQIELRQHVWKRNGIALWVGAGSIFPKLSKFDAKHILPNYGFGYRWEFKKRVNVRLDLGFGKHQTGFIFNIDEAF